MRKQRRYLLRTDMPALCMSEYRPSERLIMAMLRLAEYERPEGLTKEELRELTGASRNAFDKAWAQLLRQNIVRISVQLTEHGREEAQKCANLRSLIRAQRPLN